MAVFQLSLPPALAEGGAGTEENRKIRSYLFQLTEQLRYTLNHLDDENFSEGGISPERIAGLGTEISKAAQAEIGKAKIGAAQIQHLEAQVAKIVTATLGTAVIDWAQIKELTAAVATIARAEIAAATIGWAQVEGVTANTALFTRTEADKLFAADLAVGDANIVDLNAGKINAGTLSVERLILVGTDKSVMYEINRANGTTELSQSTLDGGSITEKTITAEQIMAQGITAECLNVSEIFASEALVGKITSRHLDVSELFASPATAGVIHTNHLAADVGGSLNISANGAITLLTGRTEELAEGMIAYADEEGWAHDYTVEAIVESINRYNELVTAGNGDEDFGKRADRLFPVEEGPFYAYPLTDTVILVNMGGLQTDVDFNVMDTEDEVIEGLYAVGNAQGGRFLVDYPLPAPGISHGMALTHGMLVGRILAQL